MDGFNYQEIFVGNAVEEGGFDPSFGNEPAAKVHSSNSEVGSGSSMGNGEHTTHGEKYA